MIYTSSDLVLDSTWLVQCAQSICNTAWTNSPPTSSTDSRRNTFHKKSGIKSVIDWWQLSSQRILAVPNWNLLFGEHHNRVTLLFLFNFSSPHSAMKKRPFFFSQSLRISMSFLLAIFFSPHSSPHFAFPIHKQSSSLSTLFIKTSLFILHREKFATRSKKRKFPTSFNT